MVAQTYGDLLDWPWKIGLKNSISNGLVLVNELDFVWSLIDDVCGTEGKNAIEKKRKFAALIDGAILDY